VLLPLTRIALHSSKHLKFVRTKQLPCCEFPPTLKASLIGFHRSIPAVSRIFDECFVNTLNDAIDETSPILSAAPFTSSSAPTA
jgi:hypothetical protein